MEIVRPLRMRIGSAAEVAAVAVTVVVLALALRAAPACAYQGQPGNPPGFTRGITLSVRIPLNRSPRELVRQPLGRRASLELLAVAATGVGQIVFSELDLNRVYIPIVAAGWGGYVAYRESTEPGYLRSAGFSRRGFGPAARDATITAGVSLAAMAGIGAARGNLRLHRDMVPLLLLYPAWGLVQQLLVQRMVAVNLTSFGGAVGSPYFVVPATATAFGAVHLPNFELAAGTFALGLAFTPTYLKHRNLWALGVYHGWLGAFYYFWVLDRNPWPY